MPGTFGYTRATEVLGVTDGIEAAPGTLHDAYLADKGGGITLLPGIIDGDPDTFSLTYQIQPAEELALKLTVACTARVGATCDIAGTDAWGDAQTENGIDISSGSAVTTKRFASVAAGGITVDGMTNADQFYIMQTRWGVVWEFVQDALYKLTANFHFGDGGTATYFQSVNEEVYFADDYMFQVEEAATLELGNLVGDWGTEGSMWSVGDDANYSPLPDGNAGTLLLYGSHLRNRTAHGVFYYTGSVDARNARFSAPSAISVRPTFDSNLAALSLKRVDFDGGQYTRIYKTGTLLDVHLHHQQAYGVYSESASLTLEDCRVTSPGVGDYRVFGAETLVALDPKAPVGTVECFSVGSIIEEDYHVNIRARAPDGAFLQTVTVACERAHLMTGSDGNVYRCTADIATAVDGTHKPVTGTNWADFWELTVYAAGGGGWTTGATYVSAEAKFSVVTDANGDIAEQQITAARWTGTDEIEERYEHLFTFSHADYPTFTSPRIVVAAPVDWEFNMGIDTAAIQAAADAALVVNHLDHFFKTTYDPASKPGTGDALMNEIVESDGGVSRFTANALEQAPDTAALNAAFVLLSTTIGSSNRSTTSCELAAGSDNNDSYVGCRVVLDDDAGDGEYVARTITGYVGSSKAITWSPAITEAAENGGNIYIIPGDTTVNVTAGAVLADTNELQTDWKNGGRLDLLIDLLVNLAECDLDVDRTKTPWELVVKLKGTDTELLRKKLYQADDTNVTAATHLVGGHTNTATE